VAHCVNFSHSVHSDGNAFDLVEAGSAGGAVVAFAATAAATHHSIPRRVNSASKYASVGSTAVDPEGSGSGIQRLVSAKLIFGRRESALRAHRSPAGDQTIEGGEGFTE
jgi:hypothetical protein